MNILNSEQIYDRTRDFLKSKRDNNLDDLATLINECRDAIDQLDTDIESQLNNKNARGISSEDRVIARTRISNLKRQRARMVNARKQLRTRLREFSDDQILSDKLDQLKADAKDPAKRAIWRNALEKNLKKFPSDIQKSARSAKSEVTKDKYQRIASELAEVVSISDADLKGDAVERFLKDHKPEWLTKISGDPKYKQQMLTIFLDALTSQQWSSFMEERGGRDEAV
jgi:hypothetical protein